MLRPSGCKVLKPWWWPPNFYGTPAEGVDPAALNDIGLVDLGTANIEMDAAGTATIDSQSVIGDRLHLIAGEPEVNVNVFTGRHTSPDNLLGCSIFQDAISVARRQPMQIDCRLLTEPADDR